MITNPTTFLENKSFISELSCYVFRSACLAIIKYKNRISECKLTVSYVHLVRKMSRIKICLLKHNIKITQFISFVFYARHVVKPHIIIL
jgi:hypothetical protein